MALATVETVHSSLKITDSDTPPKTAETAFTCGDEQPPSVHRKSLAIRNFSTVVAAPDRHTPRESIPGRVDGPQVDARQYLPKTGVESFSLKHLRRRSSPSELTHAIAYGVRLHVSIQTAFALLDKATALTDLPRTTAGYTDCFTFRTSLSQTSFESSLSSPRYCLEASRSQSRKTRIAGDDCFCSGTTK